MIVETVQYRVNWEKFRPGYSFFVPCIDNVAAVKEIDAICYRLNMKVVAKVVVEEGVKGLRVWRL